MKTSNGLSFELSTSNDERVTKFDKFLRQL